MGSLRDVVHDDDIGSLGRYRYTTRCTQVWPLSMEIKTYSCLIILMSLYEYSVDGGLDGSYGGYPG
jgi:hypothetical protein